MWSTRGFNPCSCMAHFISHMSFRQENGIAKTFFAFVAVGALAIKSVSLLKINPCTSSDQTSRIQQTRAIQTCIACSETKGNIRIGAGGSVMTFVVYTVLQPHLT